MVFVSPKVMDMQKNLKLLLSILSMVFFFIPLVSYAQKSDVIASKQFSLAPMLENTTASVVKITVSKENSLAPFQSSSSRSYSNKEVGLGSGVIIDASQGLIVTNAHVISQSKIILVTLKNGRRYLAKFIGEDDGFDIAVIQIRAKHLTSIPFGDSDQLQVGEFVAAIGSPFGLTQTVTSGVISALNRSEPKIEGYQSFIQTDTSINPGNSGGALVNLKGEFIGMNTALVSPLVGNVGIGFAIPSNMVRSVAQQLVRYGKVKRGMLGVVAQNITPSLADALNLKSDRGAVVTEIIPNSPADKIGLKVADIIETLNDKPIRSAEQLRNSLGMMRPDTPIKLAVSRQSKKLLFTTQVGDPQKLSKQQELPFIGGLQLQDFSELESNGIYLKGVIVTGVGETSAGALAGLEVGDVIIKANNQVVTSITQLQKVAESKPRELLLQISRDNTGLFLVVEKEEE